jgi:hypothetical protein
VSAVLSSARTIVRMLAERIEQVAAELGGE